MWCRVTDRESDGVWSWSVQSVGMEQLQQLQCGLHVRDGVIGTDAVRVCCGSVLLVRMGCLCKLQCGLSVQCRVTYRKSDGVWSRSVQPVGIEQL